MKIVLHATETPPLRWKSEITAASSSTAKTTRVVMMTITNYCILVLLITPILSDNHTTTTNKGYDNADAAEDRTAKTHMPILIIMFIVLPIILTIILAAILLYLKFSNNRKDEKEQERATAIMRYEKIDELSQAHQEEVVLVLPCTWGYYQSLWYF